MKETLKNNKGWKLLFVMEIVFFFLLLCFSFRTRYRIHLTGEQLEVVEGSIVSECVTKDNGMVAIAVSELGDENRGTPYCEGRISLPRLGGAYELVVNYANIMAEEPQVLEGQCYVKILPEESSNRILSNEQRLYDNSKVSEGMFWIKPSTEQTDVRLVFCVDDVGLTAIESVTITESLKYRIAMLVLYVSFCAMGWLFVWGAKTMSPEQKGILIVLLGIIIYSSLPLFMEGIYLTTDMKFHLKRIGSLAEGLLRGEFPVRYQPEVANGFGYVEHIFYPNLFLYVPAIIYMLDVPLYVCYKIYLLLINIATTGVAYWSYKKIFNSRIIGVLGTGIYTLAIYRIYNLYGLNAIGELSAKIFFPLLCYGLWKLVFDENEKKKCLLDYLPILIAGIGIICSHVLTCEMLLFFLPAFLILNWRKYFRRDILWSFGKILMIAFGCCAAFLLPFLDGLSMSMKVNQWEGTGSISGFAVNVMELFRTVFIDKDSAISLGNTFLIGALLFGICVVNRKKWEIEYSEEYSMMCSIFGLGVLSIVMCTNVFPWDYLFGINEKLSWMLGVVQFPWRYLSFAIIFMTLVTCYSVKVICAHVLSDTLDKFDKVVMIGLSIGMIAISVLESTNYMGHYVNSNAIVNYGYMNNDINFELALRDYVPKGVKRDDYKKNEPIFSSELIAVNEYHPEGSDRYYTIHNKGEEGYIDLPVFGYEQLQAIDASTEKKMTLGQGEKGRLRLVVPTGYEGTVKISFVVPKMWRAAELISVVSCLGCILAVYIQKKNIKKIHRNRM